MDLKKVTTNNADDMIVIDCIVGVRGKTGVEMEALTGCTIAALTIYDMCKALSHDIIIHSCQLVRKTGGKSDVNIRNRGIDKSKNVNDEKKNKLGDEIGSEKSSLINIERYTVDYTI